MNATATWPTTQVPAGPEAPAIGWSSLAAARQASAIRPVEERHAVSWEAYNYMRHELARLQAENTRLTAENSRLQADSDYWYRLADPTDFELAAYYRQRRTPAATTSGSMESSGRVAGEYTVTGVDGGLVVTISGELARAGIYPKTTNGSCDILVDPAGTSWQGADGVTITTWKDLGAAKAGTFVRDGETCSSEIDIPAGNAAGKLDWAAREASR